MTPEVDEVALQALELIDRERIPHVLIGGLAVNVWGVPRTTFDIDLDVDLPRERIPALLEAAEAAGFFFDEALARGFTEKVGGRHPLIVIKRWVGAQAVHVDLFLAETPLLRQVLGRAVSVELAGKPRRVATPADLILLKLLAWRRKDQTDILNIVAVQGVPDEPYLRREAERLGVSDRLVEILQNRV